MLSPAGSRRTAPTTAACCRRRSPSASCRRCSSCSAARSRGCMQKRERAAARRSVARASPRCTRLQRRGRMAACVGLSARCAAALSAAAPAVLCRSAAAVCRAPVQLCKQRLLSSTAPHLPLCTPSVDAPLLLTVTVTSAYSWLPPLIKIRPLFQMLILCSSRSRQYSGPAAAAASRPWLDNGGGGPRRARADRPMHRSL